MTVIRPNSVSGINSITVASGAALAVHKADGTLIQTIAGATGVSTFSSISVGTGYTDNSAPKSINIGLGASIAQHDDNALTFGTNGDPRITIDASGNFNVGSAATIKAGGNATFSGIVTATSFKGDGSGLSGISAGTSLSGSTDNTVCTVTGANAIQGEANLTFNGTRLDISGSAQNQLQLNSTNSDGPNIELQRSGSNLGYFGSAAANTGGTATDLAIRAANNLIFASNGGNERLRIASDGKIGINIAGSDNTSPVRNLDIADSSGAILRLISTDDSLGANERLGEIEFYSDDDDNAHIGAFIKAIADPSDAAGRRTALLFGTQNHDASVNAVEKLRIDCNGKLGLGTNNPQKNLHVYASSVATLRIETGDSRGQAWDILSTNGSGTNTGTLSFRNEAGSSYLDLAANGGSPKTTIRNGGSNDLLVVDNNGYVTQPYLPSFMAYGNSSYTTISAGANLIPYVFPNTAHNTGNHYNTTSGKFTAPVTGVYQLNWNIFCKSDTNQTSAATIEFYVQKNGGNVGRLHNKKGYGNMGDDQQIINLHVFEKLNANDEIRIAVYAYTVDWKIYGGHSTFSGALIG